MRLVSRTERVREPTLMQLWGVIRTPSHPLPSWPRTRYARTCVPEGVPPSRCYVSNLSRSPYPPPPLALSATPLSSCLFAFYKSRWPACRTRPERSHGEKSQGMIGQHAKTSSERNYGPMENAIVFPLYRIMVDRCVWRDTPLNPLWPRNSNSKHDCLILF